MGSKLFINKNEKNFKKIFKKAAYEKAKIQKAPI
jgi:hypothetical protein